MGKSRTDLFTVEQNDLADITRALSHPARIRILQYLAKQDSCVCGDLVAEIGLAQATISQHLKELKNKGLIKGTIEGASVCYCIDLPAMSKIQSTLMAFFNQFEQKEIDCCT
ncbi:MAG: transcriptional regulator [Flavobacteriaceae bacterium]|nr:transcriptional regulator [Flavobacteriaceae bacterium]